MEVDKPQPYTYDLGNLLINDPTPLPRHTPTTLESTLQTTAQATAQGLLHQLLTACPIVRSTDDAGALHIKLPTPSTLLPREKPVPKAKEKTTWEKFAEKKGIGKKRKEGNLKFDEGKGEWRKKYGFKGAKGDSGMDGKGGVSADWITEVLDEKAKAEVEEKKGRVDREGKRIRSSGKRGQGKRGH
ncbi:Rhodanese- sulfurtransferase [Recurvomyces mirabilis]|nr:Rhodanese- sulfurtransferase [Recurvomyces mirabilis]